jgi:hypothetical protein
VQTSYPHDQIPTKSFINTVTMQATISALKILVFEKKNSFAEVRATS